MCTPERRSRKFAVARRIKPGAVWVSPRARYCRITMANWSPASRPAKKWSGKFGPVAFAPDVAVDIDDVWDLKIASLDAHTSQFYEWLPWVDGAIDYVPVEAAARREWLSERRSVLPSACVHAALERRYGAVKGREIRHAEAFQICEYGRRPS